MDWANYSVDGQISLFDLTRPTFKINKHIRLIELFAGVGSQAMALKTLGADFEHYKVVEFDKYAIASYNAIHVTDFPTMDITKVNGSDLGIVDTDKHCYIMTYSFPCQDLSVAGLGRGMTKGSGTRSGLLWEVERLLNEVDNLPQVLLMENVPQVHGNKNMGDFQNWIRFLESKGYTNFWQDLNAKNYGVAQNRNRCFMVSILGNYNYTFPKSIELTKTMKDYLEDSVNEKYYINNEKAQKLIDTLVDNGTIPRAEQSRAEHVSTLQLTNQDKSMSQTVSKQDMMQGLSTSKQMEAVLLKSKGTELEKFTNVSNTLMARDYKGFGNQAMNGVIEWNEK